MPFKSGCLDGIIPARLAIPEKYSLNWLRQTFKIILDTGINTEMWLRSKVVFNPKAGYPSHCTRKDFRPSSLSSFMLKTA